VCVREREREREREAGRSPVEAHARTITCWECEWMFTFLGSAPLLFHRFFPNELMIRVT